MKKRLLFLTLSDVSRTPYFELALPSLARDGWDITMVAPNAENAILSRVLPYPCLRRNLRFGSNRISKEARVFRELISAVTGKYDLIYLQSAALGARAMLGVFGTGYRRKPIIYQTYDYFDPIRFPLHARMEGALLKRVSGYCNAEYHRALLAKTNYRCDCLTLTTPPVLPGSWPIPPRRNELRALMSGGTPGAFVIMLHGGYNVHRRVDELFEALARLPERYRLVMTSSGNNEPMVDQRLRDLGIHSRVLRLGSLDFEQLLEYTVNADVGLLLYSANDLGNYFQAPGRLTEYLACGLPAVVTDSVVLENLVLKFPIGIAVDSRSPDELARAIKSVDASKQQGQFGRSAIRQAFEAHFSFDRHEMAVCGLFDAVRLGKAE